MYRDIAKYMYKNITLSNNPIFIVGCPRSGTTLLQALLSTQYPICSFRETHFFTKIKPELVIDVTGHVKKCCLNKIFELLHSILDLQLTGKERDYITALTIDNKLTPKRLFEIIVYRMLSEQYGTTSKSVVWLEKTPDHALHLEEICDWYASARVIHIVRHPVPVIYSMINNFKFLEDRSVSLLAERWLVTIEAVDSLSRRLSILTVKYEDLVNNVNKVIKSICGYLHVEFNQQALNQYTAKAKVITTNSESWKRDVQKQIISNSNSIALKKCTIFSKMLIYFITRKKSTKYGYFKNMPLINVAYLLWKTMVPSYFRLGIRNIIVEGRWRERDILE